MGKFLDRAIEKAHVLDNDIMVYQRDRSSEDIAKGYIYSPTEIHETREPVILILEDKDNSLTE